MNRMTEVSPSGLWTVKDNDGKPLSWDVVTHEVYGAICKLKDYEETGLSPHDVEEMKEMERWIPVEEMVPEDYKFCLVFVKTADYRNIHYRDTFCIGEYEHETGWMLVENPKVTNLRITHWKPLFAPGEVE